jgi:hypothetical protein
MLKTKKLNWFLISTLFVSFFLTNSCKKLSSYKHTVVIGKVTNMAIEKGIPNARVYLQVGNNSGRSLPKKAQIMLETRTDSEGNYRFEFDAYDPFINNTKSKAAYGVVYDSEGKIQTIATGYEKLLYFKDIFGIDIKPFKHIDEIGGTFVANINVVLEAKFRLQFFNEKPVPSSIDSTYVFVKNKFVSYRQFGVVGYDLEQINGFLLNNYIFSLITGENTLSYQIYKNGIHTIKDTTFIVEPKDYLINVRY